MTGIRSQEETPKSDSPMPGKGMPEASEKFKSKAEQREW